MNDQDLTGITAGDAASHGSAEWIASQWLWQGTPLTWALTASVIAAAIAIAWLAWRRSGYRRAVAIAETLRVAAIASAALLLNQPEWVQSFRPTQRPTLAVLVDRSPSMQTRDLPEAGVANGGPADNGGRANRESVPGDEAPAGDESRPAPDATRGRRADVVDRLSDPSRWLPADADWQVIVETFGDPDDEAAGTDLASPLAEITRRLSSPLGIVLISDGDWNRGRPPVEAASQLRARGIPLFAIPVGSPTRLPDLELAEPELPTTVALGKELSIPYAVESWLPNDIQTTLTIEIAYESAPAPENATDTRGDRGRGDLGGSDIGRVDRGESAPGGEGAGRERSETIRESLEIAAMSRLAGELRWQPDREGDYRITMSLPVEPGEAIEANNRTEATVSVRTEQLRVFLAESLPRWEYRYLRNALSRDPGIEVTCLLFHPDLNRLGGGSADYAAGFPNSVEAISPYDVVILGDVGTDDGQLTPAQCGLVRGLVERQAGGLILIPGRQGRQLQLLATELADLFPVRLDETRPRGHGMSVPAALRLTESGRRSLLTRLADDPGDNVRVWDELPGFQWHAPVIRAKPGAEVLAVHDEASDRFGRLPLLVHQPFAAGKVLFLGTDGAWRWREGVEDRYHYRFWGQVVRWMAYQRNMARGETMRMYHRPEQPRVDRVVTLHAQLMSETGEPLQDADAVVRVRAPSGDVATVSLAAETGEWGVYRGEFEPREPGRHELRLICRQTPAPLETSLFVRGDGGESPGRPARPEVLEELAVVTGGLTVPAERMAEILDRLSTQPTRPPAIRRVAVWSHPATAAWIIALLGLFWGVRKRIGLL